MRSYTMARRLLAFGFILTLISCHNQQRFRAAHEAFDRKYYALAAKLYEHEYNTGKDATQLAIDAFGCAESYARQERWDLALPWYKKAYEADDDQKYLWQYAQALKRNGQYEEALGIVQLLYRNSRANAIRKEIAELKQCLDWAKVKDYRYNIRSLNIERQASDICPIPLENGRYIISSDRAVDEQNDPYGWSGRSRFASYFYDDGRSFTIPSTFAIERNTHHIINSVTEDYVYYTKCDREQGDFNRCRMYRIPFSKKNGSKEEEISANFDPRFQYIHPCAINDTSVLFASDVEGGQGAYDLYLSYWRENGGWSSPVSLSTELNTAGDELWPTIFNDTIYFSSNGRPGLGGLDIYYTWYDPGLRRFTPPQRMPYPVNSFGDDFHFYRLSQPADSALWSGLWTSNRQYEGGNDEVYLAHQYSLPSVPIKEELKDTQYSRKTYLSLRFFEKNADPLAGSSEYLDSVSVIVNGEVVNLGRKRYYLTEVQENTEICLEAGRRQYLNNRLCFDTVLNLKVENDTHLVIEKRLGLIPINENREIELKDVYYDFDKWEIRQDAISPLQSLVGLLEANPRMKIEIGSHTDCRGGDNYNLDLSRKRAGSVVHYLQSCGISGARLQSRGFGATKPRANCICKECTEEQHQENRRTTFRILSLK